MTGTQQFEGSHVLAQPVTWNYFANDVVGVPVNLTIHVQDEFSQLLRRLFGGLDVFRESIWEVRLGDSPIFDVGWSYF